MLRPTMRRLVCRTVPAVAAVLLGSLALPQTHATTVPTARSAGTSLLSCTIRTAPGHPITLTPAVTTAPRTVRVRATMHLTDCRASTSAGRALRTGTVSITGRMRASCSSVTPLDGSATITWKGASGKRVGTSTVLTARRTVNSANVSDGLLAGRITKGLLSGAEVSGSTTPTSDVTRCGATGLRSLSGTGKITISR